MDNYEFNKRLFNSINLDFFNIEKLKSGVILVKVFLENIDAEEGELFIKTLDLLITEGHNKIIIDLTDTVKLDKSVFYQLSTFINKLTPDESSVCLIVAENNPRITFKDRYLISNIDLHLSLKSAINKFE